MTVGSTRLLKIPSRSRWHQMGAASAVTFHCRRTFFASSTDHTTLLSNSTVHCVDHNDGINNEAGRQYILLPHDTPLDLAIKVDKLHLARLQTNQNLIHSAKVVQRTLGSKAEVCKPLLDQALEDISSSSLSSSQNNNPIALAALDGLCQWVSKAIQEQEDRDNNNSSSSISSSNMSNIQETLIKWKMDDNRVYEAVKAIATGIPRPGHSVVGQGTYRDGGKGWIELAELYVHNGLTDEGELYQSKGGKFIGIDHLANTSREGLIDYGGAMARFEF